MLPRASGKGIQETLGCQDGSRRLEKSYHSNHAITTSSSYLIMIKFSIKGQSSLFYFFFSFSHFIPILNTRPRNDTCSHRMDTPLL